MRDEDENTLIYISIGFWAGIFVVFPLIVTFVDRCIKPLLTLTASRSIGGAIPIPTLLFWTAVLGALCGCIIDLIRKRQKDNAGIIALAGSFICGSMNLSFINVSGYPLLHPWNVDQFLPTVVLSGFMFIWGLILFRQSVGVNARGNLKTEP